MLLLQSRDGTAGRPVVVVVEGSNDAPVAGSVQTFTVTEDGTVPGTGSIFLLAGASDPDGDVLSVIGVQGSAAPGVAQGTFGSMSWSNAFFGSGTYVLDNARAVTQALKADETGIDRFYVTIADGQGGTAVGEIRIEIAGANDPAQILGGTTGVVVDGMIPQASGQLVVQDPDAGESIFAVPDTSAGLYGAFAFDPDLGIWSYALTPGKAALVALGARMSTSPRWPPTPAFASRSVVSRRSRSARRWRHPATSMATVAPTWSWAAAGPPSLSSGSRTRRS